MKQTKKIIYSLLLLTSFFGYSQEVTIKKNAIQIDQNEVLLYEKINAIEYSILDKSKNEIINLQFKNYDTAIQNDEYMVLYFVNEKKIVNSSNTDRVATLGAKNMVKNFITWLVKEKVINLDGTINNDKIDNFSIKYGN